MPQCVLGPFACFLFEDVACDRLRDASLPPATCCLACCNPNKARLTMCVSSRQALLHSGPESLAHSAGRGGMQQRGHAQAPTCLHATRSVACRAVQLYGRCAFGSLLVLLHRACRHFVARNCDRPAGDGRAPRPLIHTAARLLIGLFTT